MNFELLMKRLSDIDKSIEECTNQYKALHGHREEVLFWLKELKLAEEALARLEVKEETE